MTIAAVTMVYNEAEYLPLWLAHYGALVGPQRCLVVDHGSTDGSTDALGAPGGPGVLRLPRSPHDDAARAAFMADLCAGLLRWHDAVLHTDVDELVVTDPDRWPDLAACARAHPVATAAGFNLLQLDEDPPLDPARPPLPQRRFGWFTAAMCKPVLIRRRVAWAPGFHCIDARPSITPGLFLFHLRYADAAIAAARLARTRAMPWADLAAGAHQRVPDSAMAEMLAGLRRMDRRADIALDADAPPLSDWLARLHADAATRDHQPWRLDLDLACYQLWHIPARLRGAG